MSGYFRQSLDLPLGERTPTRWVGWIAATLIAVTVIAVALAAAASRAASREALAPTLVTVLLPAPDGSAGDVALGEVVAALSAIPGVAFARPVTAAELGLAPAPGAAPMPRFVDLALNPGHPADLGDLSAHVAAIAPAATVAPVDPAALAGWSIAAIRDLALAVGLAALVVLLLAVAGLTRLSLALHRDTIDLLRQLGADDRYIARQLGQHALGGTLRGGLLGFLAGMAVLVGLMTLVGGGPPQLAMAPLDWLAPAVVPPVAAFLARLAADLAARPHGG